MTQVGVDSLFQKSPLLLSILIDLDVSAEVVVLPLEGFLAIVLLLDKVGNVTVELVSVKGLFRVLTLGLIRLLGSHLFHFNEL